MKRLLLRCFVAASMLPLTSAAGAAAADKYPIPASNAAGLRGATMPYTRYECNKAGDAALSGGAAIVSSPDWDAANKATQAGNQAYVKLPQGGAVAWTMRSKGDGVTVRYTIADKNQGGTGKANGYASSEGQLKIYVNGMLDRTVDLTSYYMYQYFSKGSGSPSQSGGTAPCFCFDEKHVRLSRVLVPGDVIKVECASGEEVGVDFIETEVVAEALDPNDDNDEGRPVFDVTSYGASTSAADNVDAFNRAVAAARAAGGGIVFIPEGTWKLGQMWSIAGKNIKIMGAGIWHTNLQFTGFGQYGGGISGGNPSNGPFKSNEMDNIEFCHMYINSNLADRHGENAVYKCFMDIWCGGSVIHDVWEEHFECGLWFGDYNSTPRRCSDGVRVVNCRLRNNYADGVNFCQGTSNAAVFNCSVRNNGDDGLACWNNTQNVKDESGNVFAYNTIDFVWRAGGVAIYGGKNQKVYNNYICDMFMASGIHLNTSFPGPGFATTSAEEPILVENNYLVRCGTPWECWGRDYAAIDLEGNVKNVVFRNNYVYESPAEIVRIKNAMEGIVFDGLYCNGAGLCKQTVNYSASDHSVGAGNLETNDGISWNKFLITRGSVPAATVGNTLNQYASWPFWNAAPTNWEWTDEEYDTPPYPDAMDIEPAEDPFETLTDYDVVLTGIDWLTNKNKHNIYAGDEVSFRVRIDNKGANDIPENAKFSVTVTVDENSKYSISVKGGLKAGASKTLEFNGTWLAETGKHTFKALIDPTGKMKHETNRDNNSREKRVNVEVADPNEGQTEIVTSPGTDMAVLKVWFEKGDGDKETINVGDELVPHVLVANLGTNTVTLRPNNGVQWQIDGFDYGTGSIVWCDAVTTIESGKTAVLTPTGGGGMGAKKWTDKLTWIVTSGEHTLTAWLDGIHNNGDNNEANDRLTVNLTYPKARPEYFPEPDKADNLVTGGLIPYEDDEVTGISQVHASNVKNASGAWFTLSGMRLNSVPVKSGIYIHNGRKVIR